MKTQEKVRLSFLILLLVAVVASGALIGRQVVINAQAEQADLSRLSAPPVPSRPERVIELDKPEWRQNVPLAVLARESSMIVIAKALRNGYRQSPNGEITTEYQIQLQDVIKGDMPAESIVPVVLPGGTMPDTNGDLLVVRTRRLRKMENGKRYVLFLKDAGRDPGTMTSVRGSQGIYELPQHGLRVVHYGRSIHLPLADDGEEVPGFLRAIRRLRNND